MEIVFSVCVCVYINITAVASVGDAFVVRILCVICDAMESVAMVMTGGSPGLG